jgi:hypothetical protein
MTPKRRSRRPDFFLILVLLVGIGVVVSTQAGSADADSVELSDLPTLSVSAQGLARPPGY